jgi:hypothetical protein
MLSIALKEVPEKMIMEKFFLKQEKNETAENNIS